MLRRTLSRRPLTSFTRLFSTTSPLLQTIKPLTAYATIDRARLSEPREEMNRLMRNKAVAKRMKLLQKHDFFGSPRLTPPAIKRSGTDCGAQRLFSYPATHAMAIPEIAVAIGRAFEIVDTFSETHYVFTHGQAGQHALALNLLIRSMQDTDSLLPFQTVINSPFSASISFNHYSPNPWEKYFSGKEIVTDAYLASTANRDSALSFVIQPHQPTFRTIEAHEKMRGQIMFDAGIQDTNQFNEKFDHIITEMKSKVVTGTLYTICVPKEYFHFCGYLAQQNGKPCILPAEMTTEKMLAQMQHFTLPTGKTSSPVFTFPQVKLDRSRLHPDQVMTFAHPTMSDEHFLSFQEQIKELVCKHLAAPTVDATLHKHS